MKIIQNKYLQIAILSLSLAGTATANTVTVLSDSAAPGLAVWGIVDASLSGFDMVALGLTVKVHFGNSAFDDPNGTAWTTNSGCNAATVGGGVGQSGCGLASAAVGGNSANGSWTLTTTGNTGAILGGSTSNPEANAVNAWTLSSNATGAGMNIVSVELIGSPRLVFDRDRATGTGTDSTVQDEGTPSSKSGITMWTPGSETKTVSTQYTSLVSLLVPSTTCLGSSSTPPFNGNNTATGCGDEWNRVVFTFTGAQLLNNSFVFFQDTDQVGTPEPMTIGLVGFTLVGLFMVRKRLAKASR